MATSDERPLVSADLISPTFASNMRANVFSRQRAVYLQQHEKRMREFKDRPYLKHCYPEIPAHRPGTWQAYSWTKIDNVVTRLSHLPNRWVVHLDRQKALSPVSPIPASPTSRPVSREQPTCEVNRPKPCSDRIDSLARPKSTPPRSQTVFYIGGRKTVKEKQPTTPTTPTFTEGPSSELGVTPTKRMSLEKDNEEVSDRFRPASRNIDSSRFGQFRFLVDYEEGDKKKVDFLDNVEKNKTNAVTPDMRCKSAPPRRVRYFDQISRSGRDKEIQEIANSLYAEHDPEEDVAPATLAEASMKFGYSKRPRSVGAAQRDPIPKEQHWSFDQPSVVSSVLGLLQTVTSNNGRLRPTSAMSSYRSKFSG